jgi:hypothetical protein
MPEWRKSPRREHGDTVDTLPPAAETASRRTTFFPGIVVKRNGYFLGWVAMIWSLILLYVALGRTPLETSWFLLA